MIKVSVYYRPSKTRDKDKPWCVTAFNGTFSNTTRWTNEEDALSEKARIEEANV